ncbi:MAG TPA: hypothetical protein VFH47_07530 [Candidatus Thermoplasmatota archaeon]|nr:hypothetical protein [Candidatus Thermoplasmatota archaeon]
MVNLRCAKCGSDSGFLIETSDKKVLTVKGKLPTDRILKTVLCTCMYCNNHWDHVPITLTDKALDNAVKASEKKLVL